MFINLILTITEGADISSNVVHIGVQPAYPYNPSQVNLPVGLKKQILSMLDAVSNV